MSSKIPILALWLFVINLGIVFGAGLYEARIDFPQWLVTSADGEVFWDATAAKEANTGLRFWVFASTITLTLLTLLNLVLAFRSHSTVRKWWITAGFTALADRAFTFLYFIPTMITLIQDEGLSGSDAVDMASLWGNLNHLRHFLVLLALITALKTFRDYHPNKMPTVRRSNE